MTVLGIYSDDSGGHTLAKLETALGQKFAQYRINAAMTYDVPGNRDDAWADKGYRIYHNSNAETIDAKPWGGGWAALANGSQDDYFHKCAARFKADGRYSPSKPFDWSVHHEQGVSSVNQCGVGCAGSAEDYKAFYRHISNLMHNDGATIDEGGPVRLVWTPTISQFLNKNPATATKCDPDLAPDDSTIVGRYYHLVGVDCYSRINAKGLSIPDPKAALSTVANYAVRRGLPWVIGEYGCQDGSTTATHDQKATYLTDSAAAIKSLGGCEYWCYSHISTGHNWLDSSPQAMQAYQGIVADPFYRGSSPALDAANVQTVDLQAGLEAASMMLANVRTAVYGPGTDTGKIAAVKKAMGQP